MMDGTSYCIDPDSWAAERAAALGSTPVVIAIDDKIVAKYGGLANLNAPHETRIPVEHFDSISPDGEWTVPSIFQKSELYLNHGARGTISGRWASAAISWLVQDRAAEF
ncbi:hypothetical protein C2E31_07275 [Rhodopirellula baltica]|nr:hypothetical protein C2E31_07275 [Rhodopirellula baltica]